MRVRQLTDLGTAKFRSWLETRRPGELPPPFLLDGEEETSELLLRDIERDQKFETRFELGRYLVEAFKALPAQVLLSEKNDGLWNWLTVVYFEQIGKKTSKYWHYVVTRRGHAGSLAYRHLVRTSFEMYWRHREKSLVMLSGEPSTWGDMSEQLTSRQNVAYHHGFIAAANELYLRDGRVIRGAASRLKPISKRRPGDRTGRGNVARLALAVRRLCRTYDTHELPTNEMLQLLPKEFGHFTTQRN